MTEKTVLEIQNLPESSTWPEIRSLFSEFGNIVKLYIDPTGSFGRVVFDNIESAANAQRELDGKPPLYISVSIQATKGFKARPQSPSNCSNNSFDRNSLTSPVAKMSNRNSYRNNYGDVEATLSHQYVDVFGRLVTTLESDDGEVYVSLDELKKSGFELFLSGNLPKRGHYIEEKLLGQFEMYMKIKARKFLSRTNQFSCSEDKVNEIIDEEKKQFFDGRPKRVCEENSTGSITVTTPGTAAANQSPRARTTPNQNRNWSNTNDVQRRRSRSSNRGDFDQQRNSCSSKEDWNANSKPMRRPYTNNYNKDSNTNNSTDRRSGPRQDSSNFNTPNDNWDSNAARPSRRPGPKRDSSNFNDSNSANPSTRRPESRNSFDMNEPRANPSNRRPESRNSSDMNEPRPLTRVSLPLNTSQKEDDGTYIVNTTKSETPQSTLKQNFPPKPPSTAPAKPEIKSSLKPSTSTSESSLSQRKNVTDDVCDTGLFECIEVVNDTTFVGFAMPTTYNEEISTLETITAECKADPSFKPGLGDLVAVPKDDEYVRGTVINNLNGRYTCALVDYGVVASVEEVRPLPEKFKGIPEFSCLCTAEGDIVKQISAAPENTIMLKIESAAVLKLTLGDKEFVVKSSRWNPFDTSPLAIQKPVKETQTVFKNCLGSKQLKIKDIVIIAAEQEGSLLVRTRECNSLLKEINQELSSHKGEPFKKKPEVGQLAVCSYSDNTLYRVIITSITDTSATVEYIDYGNSDTVDLRELKTISEKLATTDKTLIKISLKGFVKTKFSQAAIALLATCSEKKEKFVVEAASGENVYELVAIDKTNLSEKLLAADKQPSAAPTNAKVSNENPPAPVQKKLPYLTLDDLPPTKLTVGSNKVMCLYTAGIREGNVTVCSASPEVSELLSELTIKVAEYAEKDDKPYTPEILEVCLAQYEGEWYRATCIEKGTTNTYALYYIDYGNTKDVKAEEIRKMPPELSKIECVALFCVLDGVLKEGKEIVEDRLLKRIQSDIKDNEFYDIEVLEVNKTYCRITIPSLLEGWKKAGLL